MGNKIPSHLKEPLKAAKETRKLSLSGMNLSTIPVESFGIKGLEEVWLQENEMEIIDPTVSQWKEIKLFYAYGNCITQIPQEVENWELIEEVCHFFCLKGG